MFRSAVRPLTRQSISSLALARAVSTARPSVAMRPVAQTALEAYRRPQLSVVLSQSLLMKRTFASHEKQASNVQKANERQASVDYQHTTSGARDEVRAVVKDFAEIIAGRSPQAAAAGARENLHASSKMSDDFWSVTRGLAQSIPPHILFTGALGAVPYLGTAIGTIFLSREASVASAGRDTLTGIDLETALSSLHHLETIQITYGAIILSFLGALHWGMEFSRYGGEQGYNRLALGVVPVLIAWPTTFLTHGVALAVQWAGFTGMWLLDQRASSQGWTPDWYSTYRFYLSIIVGFSIIATLTGTSYYGAGSGATRSALPGTADATSARVSPLKRIDVVKSKNDPRVAGKHAGKVGGAVEAVDLAKKESGDGYVKLVNHEKDGEEAQKEEEEKTAKAERQDTKEIDQAAKSPEGFKSETKGRVNMNDQSHPTKGGSRGDGVDDEK